MMNRMQTYILNDYCTYILLVQKQESRLKNLMLIPKGIVTICAKLLLTMMKDISVVLKVNLLHLT